uniref:Ribosyldihydronicotinamide dehydrogenase [quinone] n=2 Tax=Latimeria chalumnae TaxID=7897 RepID=H3AHP9_LATCH
MKDAAVAALKKQSCEVTVSDLYAMNFNPVNSKSDIKGNLKDPNHFRYGEETGLAYKEGRLSSDIIEEQKKLQAADLVIFQFPFYWFSMPAILKGWFDRVFTQGFAYSFRNMYEDGFFKEKKAILSFTTGGVSSMYTPKGINGDINVVLWPIQNGILRFCGFQVLAPQTSWCPGFASPEARIQMLEDWKSRLENVWEEDPINFIPNDHFGMTFQGGFILKKEVEDAQAMNNYGLTVGQHMDKLIPPNNQTKGKGK